MSSRFILPFADVGSGIKPSSGAKLFFFETDGVTPKDTFSDQLATPTPNANPVIADSNGVFGDIFITGTYKVDLQDKNGSQIFGGVIVEEVVTGSSQVRTPINYATLSDAENDSTVKEGSAANVVERTTGNGGGAMWDFVLTTSVTPNGFNIVISIGEPLLSLVLRDLDNSVVSQYGMDSAALQGMASAIGLVELDRAITLTTTTIDVPIHFRRGAYISVAPGNTVTITNTIDSPRQFIFRGDGDIVLDDDGDSGENSRQIHASWFNVIPVNNAATDMQPQLAKLFLALGTDREAVVDFDIGRYPLGASSQVPRATWVRGMGSRRTIFEVLGNGFDVFTCGSNGCRFSGIQFELSDAYPTDHRTSGYYINSNQQLTELDDVFVGNANQNILLSGGKSEARKISATFDESVVLATDSAVINIEASDCDIDGVKVLSDQLGPESVVSVGGLGINNISEVNITKIRHSCKSKAVEIQANSKFVNGINVSAIAYRGISGFEASELIEVSTSGTGVLSGVNLSSVVTNENLVDLFKISQDSSVSMSLISLSDVKSRGTGVGVDIERTAGTLSGITIDQTVDLSSFATPISKVGTMNEVSISPVSQPNTNFPIVYEFNIPDDGVVSIPFSAGVFSGTVMASITFTEFVNAIFRTFGTPQILEMDSSANATVSTGPLTGTTGVDGQFTVSADTDTLYFENRLGGSKDVGITLLVGAK